MNATLIRHNGRTFKVELKPACDPVPRGWIVSERDVEPNVTWTFWSGVWKTKREAMASLPGMP